MTSIYPCFWFDQQASEAFEFYHNVFPGSKIQSQNAMVTTIDLLGIRLMALNGGPKYKISPAISLFVYTGDALEIDRLYHALSQGGMVRIPLGEYPWSPRYAWVEDRFGVNWQLDVDPINNPQKVVPALLFTNEKRGLVKAAIDHYASIFPISRILMESPFPPEAGMSENALLFAQIKINGFILNAMSSWEDHTYTFSPGNSLVVECQNQEEIDHYWENLGRGGRYDRCGWLVDRFGVSWQIVPTILPALMQDPTRGPRVVEAFLKMQKFDIQTLLDA